MGFGSKYFGWLAAFGIVLGLGWLAMPDGWNTVVEMFAPHFGNYVRPTVALVNLLLVNPLSNFIALGIWAAAGFVGGIIAGTKKGAFVVGFVTWISSIVLLVFCGYMMIQGGFALGIPAMPPGSSITDLLSIPLVQDLIGVLFNALGLMGGGMGTSDILALLAPVLLYLFTPVIIIIITGMIGATIRPKE